MHLLPWQRSRVAGPAVKLLRILTLMALTGGLAAGTAAHAAESGLSVSQPWLRMIIPSRTAAGNFTLSNAAAKAQVLIGASSPACDSIMLHQSLEKNGTAHMVMVESLNVPAHGAVKFAPGGYHLMCMSPSKDVAQGHSIPITLHFADGSTLTTNFPVRGATGK